jgi:hypothetical protein
LALEGIPPPLNPRSAKIANPFDLSKFKARLTAPPYDGFPLRDKIEFRWR